MADSGYGHVGRIPSYGHRQPDSRVMAEPPACIQNAMMTKDKKPFTYTPGGLDLSQIKTPSMVRRLARQRSQEEQEQAYQQQQANQQQQNAQRNGGGPPPPPPFEFAPPPPPPPPLVIHTPAHNQANPQSVIRPMGERPEIVIPENPIGMLRKTNSPYHWEQEQAEKEQLNAIPKFIEKVPSPVTQHQPPTTFSQQPPTSYTPQPPVRQNYPYGATRTQKPESPVHKPEPQYPAKHSPSPLINQTPTRDLLQRQDSQFNKSPAPFGSPGSPQVNGSSISASPNNAWRQPEKLESPAYSSSSQQRSTFSSPHSGRSTQYTPYVNQSPVQQNESPVYHTLPRASLRVHDNYANHGQSPPRNVFSNTIFNNVQRPEQRPNSPKVDPNNPTPWRTNTTNLPTSRQENNPSVPSQNYNTPLYKPAETIQQYQQQNPWKQNQLNQNNQSNSQQQPNNQDQQWNQTQQNQPNQWNQNKQNDWRDRNDQNSPPEVRYQTSMTLPVTPMRQQQHYEPERQQSQPPQPQKEAVYVTQEPVYYNNQDSPKYIPPWVKTQKEKTPPPEWVQRPLDGRKSLTRELVSPPRDNQRVEPEWVQKSMEMRSTQRELSSPPPMQQCTPPNWSTRPSENRKSAPRESQPLNHVVRNGHGDEGSRVVPIQIETNQHGNRPHLRISIDMQNAQHPHMQSQAQPPYSQPTQRIMRVLSPQLVRMDQPEPSRQPDLASLNEQPRTRIIPIQIEGGGSEATNRRVLYHKFATEGPPRQSRAFRVLQIITGTENEDDLQNVENQDGFCDL